MIHPEQRCEHWIDVSDRCCRNRWQQAITLAQSTHVGGHTMLGTYPAGTWHFCDMHAKIFERDRDA